MAIPIIEMSDLTKSYGKARGIVGVNLNIEEGEIFGFIGPNGAGKSTTIRILLNLIFASSGSARIMGLDVVKETKQIKQYIGYIPSDANAYPTMKVEEFLKYCLHFYDKDDKENRIPRLCQSFELDLRRKISDLSMGNRKKVSIVQSLMHRPRLLILDEPTTGLDPLMQATFFEILREENKQGMTIFFSSHILNEVQILCKKVAIIKDGRIIQLEDIDTLRKKQLKKVSIEFATTGECSSYHLAGEEQQLLDRDCTRSFLYAGDINDLTQSLASRRIVNLTIEEPSLEEIFMHYYQ